MSNRYRQRGVALPLVVIGLVAMLAMAGLALDSSHAYVNKTRLQNTADAAALAAAKIYDGTADTLMSTAAANSVFGINTNGSGNFEVDAAYDAGDISVIVQFSPTLNPFVPSGIGPYVRVIATGFDMLTTFSNVVGIASMPITASAVAGPSPTIDYACNIAPIAVCANDPSPTADYFGFSDDALMVLKPEPGNHEDIGAGNYKMLRLDEDNPGGDEFRDNMAGAYGGCAESASTAETEPGFMAGPTSQGFNTRFNQYAGPVSPYEFPPDVVTQEVVPRLESQQVPDPLNPGEEIDQICLGPCDDPAAPTNQVTLGAEITNNYTDYLNRTEGGMHDVTEGLAPLGTRWRRIMAMPVVDCAGDQTGQSTLDVLGFACYFMLQTVSTGASDGAHIYGQFVDGCLVGGTSGPNPGTGPGPYLIQLYKDPDSGDS
ncbi:MAG: hypothetical protein GTO71_06715 [Woeseiaceae bacterium]|nr:hypothetical protein [Woeseiaceae bacterium]NIP20787.1 hypothetical protein [Woeseiaceae bacterium]NIS89580.1 hypothetical protein [Woeseiaceae bacterium]